MITLTQNAPPGSDQVVVNVPGAAVMTGPARKAYDAAMLQYGKDLLDEAKRLEMGPRLRAGSDASPDAQFTDWMVLHAQDRVRPVRYISEPRKKWPSVLRLIAGVLFATAGAAFGFAASDATRYMSADAWMVAGLALVVVASILELTSIFAPGGS